MHQLRLPHMLQDVHRRWPQHMPRQMPQMPQQMPQQMRLRTPPRASRHAPRAAGEVRRVRPARRYFSDSIRSMYSCIAVSPSLPWRVFQASHLARPTMSAKPGRAPCAAPLLACFYITYSAYSCSNVALSGFSGRLSESTMACSKRLKRSFRSKRELAVSTSKQHQRLPSRAQLNIRAAGLDDQFDLCKSQFRTNSNNTSRFRSRNS